MIYAIPFPDISPDVFSIELWGRSFGLKWYALSYIAGILFAIWLVKQAIRRPALWPENKAPLTEELWDALTSWMIVGIIVGGRLGYVMFYADWSPLADPMRILRVWEGGMAFHGGFAGVVISGVLFCRKHNIAIAPFADVIAVASPVGLLLGRFANFINAELWGRETTVPWGVIFPGIDAQRCTEALIGACARHPSQLYEAMGEGLILGSVLLYLLFRTSALKRTGLLLGVFVAGYGVVRFLVELVRQPDIQFTSPSNPVGYALQLGDWGLTMGQLLSLPMIAFGLWSLWRARAR